MSTFHPETIRRLQGSLYKYADELEDARNALAAAQLVVDEKAGIVADCERLLAHIESVNDAAARMPVMVFCGHEGCPVQMPVMPGGSFYCSAHIDEYLAAQENVAHDMATCTECADQYEAEQEADREAADDTPTMADAIRAEQARRAEVVKGWLR